MEQFDFRKIEVGDLDFFLEVRNSCAQQFLHDSRIFTKKEAENWLGNQNPEYYIINFKGQDIGYFRTSNHEKKSKSIYIGCDLHQNFRGKGIGYQAYSLFIPYIKNKHSLREIRLEVLDSNVIARNLYQKLGFSQIEVKENAVLKSDKFVNSIVMSLNLETNNEK